MKTIKFETVGSVGVLTLQRPKARNAFDYLMKAELEALVSDIKLDKSIRCLLVTGSEGAFCGGADLKAILGEATPAEGVRRIMAEDPVGMMNFSTLDIPVVTAMNGPAAGGGVGYALQGDITLAARSSYFLLTFSAKLGLVPDLGATWYIPKRIGLARAVPMAILGEPIKAQQAEDWGLIWKCVDDDKLMDTAMDYAQRLADGPINAMVKARNLMHQSSNNDLLTQLALERDWQVQLAHEEEFKEGVNAFVEKRQPNFKQ